MKFRTFITTFLLFLAVFYAGLLTISSILYTNQLDMLKERVLDEHYFIISSFSKDLAAVERRSTDQDNVIRELFDFYTNFYYGRETFIELSDNNNILFSSYSGGISDPNTLARPKEGYRQVSVKKIEGNDYIYAAGQLPDTDNAYYFHYLYNISDQIIMWKQMQHIFIGIGTVCSVVLAFFLLLLLNKLFKPLQSVSAASKEIASGQYENRIIVAGKDEISEMALNFNLMADEIQNRMIQLIEASDQKQQYIDNFAHEIRTPLTTIYGYAEYIQKTVVDEVEKIYATDYIMNESRYMKNLANELLELATLRNKEIVRKTVSIESLFKSALDSLELKLNQRNIYLEYKCFANSIYGNEDLLRSLLINLTDNAIKACESGGCITWRSYIEDGNIILLVKDNGKGIELEKISHIAEPFYRIDKSRNRAKGGAGLGLSICEQIVECHQGNLSFESDIGVGTSVKMTFTN